LHEGENEKLSSSTDTDKYNEDVYEQSLALEFMLTERMYLGVCPLIHSAKASDFGLWPLSRHIASSLSCASRGEVQFANISVAYASNVILAALTIDPRMAPHMVVWQ
jgi:hypothetical protein